MVKNRDVLLNKTNGPICSKPLICLIVSKIKSGAIKPHAKLFVDMYASD